MDSSELLSTQQVADMLAVSASTVRRWSEDGTLTCYRVGKSQYRKFEIKDVENLKEKFYGKNSCIGAKVDDIKPNKVISSNITANAHPAHYMMHKYWGRKPHNVVADYIKNYTHPGDLVLEPFMGSGVTVIEAIKAGRRAIGIDINPMSIFIVKNTIDDVDLDLFSKEYSRIYQDLFDRYSFMYDTECPVCGAKAVMETGVWENDELKRIRVKCNKDGTQIKDATDVDILLYEKCSQRKSTLLSENKIHYPTEPIMKYVRRSGRETIDQLFSDRALVILSTLKESIDQVSDNKVRDLLLLCFTSMLPNVSRMLPGDLKRGTYKSGWVISKFWTPTVHTERNIFMCFDLRYRAVLKGKKELVGINSSLADVRIGDATCLDSIPSDSVDYIFTDPPYGESIAYLALSQFWNSWISNDVDYTKEIIIDPYRNKGYEDYSERTLLAYQELYRVLKPGSYMSFTFNNRDLNVWMAVLEACKKAGFTLENVILQEQAVSSGTQGINRKNTLTGDFLYNFKKDPNRRNEGADIVDSKQFIEDSIDGFINGNNGATPTEIYEYIVPVIVRNSAYTDANGNVFSIEKILQSKYDYVKVESNEKLGEAYKWIKKTV